MLYNNKLLCFINITVQFLEYCVHEINYNMKFKIYYEDFPKISIGLKRYMFVC